MTLLLDDVRTDVDVFVERKIETSNNESESAHIVYMPRDKNGMTPQAYVLEARIEGTEIQALCGYIWIPSKDPLALPVCEKCKSIYEHGGDDENGRNEIPDS